MIALEFVSNPALLGLCDHSSNSTAYSKQSIANATGDKSLENLAKTLFELPNVGQNVCRIRSKQIKKKTHVENTILKLVTSGVLIIRNVVAHHS